MAGVSVRPYEPGDRDFVLSLARRFVAFELPPWRDPEECAAGVRRDIERNIDAPKPHMHSFVAVLDGERAGFLHLQRQEDFFTGHPVCHVSDIVTAEGFERRGVGTVLLGHAESWARDNACSFISLAVFESNRRARALYERQGYATELLRMMRPLR